LSSQLNFSSIAALMPISESGPEGGKRTRICYSNGEAEEIGRRVKTVLKNTADHFSINLVRQRQRYGEYFQRRQGVPLPLSSGMVLVPLKMLKSSLYNDEVTGYVNASDVLEISEASPDEAALGIRCIIDLKGGHRIPCHFSVESVKRKSRTAQLALGHFRSLISAPLQKPDFSWQKEGPYFVKNIDSTLRFLYALLYNSRDSLRAVAEEETLFSEEEDDSEPSSEEEDLSESPNRKKHQD